MPRGQLSVAVLAAGRGTRMRNERPKVLHPLAGRSLIGHVLEAARALRAERLVTVLAPDMQEVETEVARLMPSAEIAYQDPPLGTGHALSLARTRLGERGTVLVLYGDTPLLRPSTLERLTEARQEEDAAVAVLAMRPPDPTGYGRLRLAADGRLIELVEHRHADAELRALASCNSGVMAIDAERLEALLSSLPRRQENGEYYLTDIVALAVERGWRCTAIEAPWQEGHGVNAQDQLATAHTLFQDRARSELLASGVVMPAPETVHLAADTVIEPGVVIEPYVVFGLGVMIRRGAVIHAFSHIEGASIAPAVHVGPFARLRQRTVLGENARIGNFVETKNAVFGRGGRANHLSYLGDCSIGSDANIGAGTITCNYDGFAKHRTTIGDGVFVGSNSALVAPLSIGDKALIGAGSVVTRDVAADSVVIARARQQIMPGTAAGLRARLRARSGSKGP